MAKHKRNKKSKKRGPSYCAVCGKQFRNPFLVQQVRIYYHLLPHRGAVSDAL